MAVGVAATLSDSVVILALGGKGAEMSNRCGSEEGLRQVRQGIRQPAAEVVVLVDPAAACEAFWRHRRFDCGRRNIGRRRVSPWLPAATYRTGGRAAGAAGLV